MKYRIIATTGKEVSVIAEVISIEWANTFAEDIRQWIKANGGEGVTKIIVEEI